MKDMCILVIEAKPLLREGLQQILREGTFTVRHGSSWSNMRGDADGTVPNLVLWGPGVHPLAVRSEVLAIRARTGGSPSVRCVAVADDAKPGTLRRLAALDLDAVLLHDINGHVLLRSLELVLLGQKLFPPMRPQSRKPPLPLQGDVVPFVPRERPGTPPKQAGRDEQAPLAEERIPVALSERERQTLACLVDGAGNKAIARQLSISEATVKVHVKALLRKLRVVNRTQAAMWAVNNAHVMPEPQPMRAPLHAGLQMRTRSGRL